MAQQQHLARAPITEALIDVRVETGDGLDGRKFDEILTATDFGYRRIGPIVKSQLDVTFDTESDKAPAFSADPITVVGARFHSPDDKYVAQMSIEGFSFSRLEPYEDWPKFIDEGRRLWDVYVSALDARSATRIATRFINDLQLPVEEGKPFAFYLTPAIGLPDEAFRKISGFLEQYFGKDTDTEATIRCMLALPSARHDKTLPIIVDIDVFQQRRFSIDDESLWGYLEKLRGVKNRVFFSLLTDACLDLYR